MKKTIFIAVKVVSGLAALAILFSLLSFSVSWLRYQSREYDLHRGDIIGINTDGVETIPGYRYKPIMTGVFKKSVSIKQPGETVTFIGLDTSSPRVSYADSGSDIPFMVMFESDNVIGIQLNTGHSFDSFVINKKSGIFAHSYAGDFMGTGAGAAIGVCK